MLRRIGMAVPVASALPIGPSAQAQEKSSGVLLTAEELKKLVEPSLLIAGRNADFSSFIAHLYVRGGVVYDVYTDDTGNGGPRTGKWRLDGDKFCITLPLFAEECRHWYRLADGSYEGRRVVWEKPSSTFRIVNKP